MISTALIREFIEDARAVSIEEAARRLGLKFSGKREEHAQPCPNCGGTDCFSFNTRKNKWNCRHGGVGGNDAIGMAAHCRDLKVEHRAGFLEACSLVTGLPVPADGERESPADREARLVRLEKRRLENLEAMARRSRDGDDFREKERNKARGIYSAGSTVPLWSASLGVGRFYLRGRGASWSDDDWLRVNPDVPYWHGQDDRGAPLALHSGPAIIAPFIGPDLLLIGCHITWIDLSARSKLRPELFGLTEKGLKARLPEWRVGDRPPSAAMLAEELYELLPSKKMRGSKKGGLIPLAGHPSAPRWVGGEGIENGLAFAGWEGFRADSFYFAAGDLGNLAGQADPASRFAHPTLTKPDRNGKPRPVMVAGCVPRPDQAPGEAMWIGDHVDELVLLADGDSERIMTASAMARARARAARPGRLIPIVWPRPGYDFARMAADAYREAGAA